jgi:hypothetical protein
MATKSITLARLALSSLLFLGAGGEAFAQGSFNGVWFIVDAHSPDWASPGAAQMANNGAGSESTKVDIRSSEVVSDSALGCDQASFQILSLRANDLFQGRAGDARRAGTSIEDAVESAGITPKSRTLRVTCGNGKTLDFHEAGKSLVVLSGEVLYTLMREVAS